MFEHPRLRAVICNSKMVRDEIRRGFRIAPEKLHVIYNGVDLEHFHPRSASGCAARRAPSSAAARATPCSLFVGSGFSRKGLDAAIDALAVARTSPSGWSSSGAGPRSRAQPSEPGSDHASSAAARTCAPYYAAADCFLLPTRYDPFPNTALEALAMGLPAIVSSRCGAAEVIEPGVNGWICQPDDVAGHRAADAGGRRGACAAMAAWDRRRARRAERFGIDAMARQAGRLVRCR